MTKRNRFYITGLVVFTLVSLFLLATTPDSTLAEVEVEKSPQPTIHAPDTPKVKTTKTIKRIDADNASILLFNTQVNADSVDLAISALYELDQNDKDIYILINSPGGSVFDGTRLFAHMKGTNNKVYTICETMCASMAAHMFEQGEKRYMMDRSVLMFHPAAGGLQGTVPEMKSLLDLIDTYTQRLDRATAKRSNIPYKDFEIMVLKNLWIEADDAVDKGLADGYIIYNAGDFKKPKFFNMYQELAKRGVKTKLNTKAEATLPIFQ